MRKLVALLFVIACVYTGWHYYHDASAKKIAAKQAARRGETPPEPPFTRLEPAKQEHIWDLEHLTFEIEWKFGKIIKDAIKHQNLAEIQPCFLDDFRGSLPTGEQEIEKGQWWHRSILSASDDQPSSEASSEAIVSRLSECFAEFSSVKGTGLRILAIDQEQADPKLQGTQTYRLTILVTASGKNKQDQPISFTSQHRLVVKFAEESEIPEGHIVAQWHVDELEVRGASSHFMREITEEAGLANLELPDNWTRGPDEEITHYTMQVGVDDFDRDGYPDIAISTWSDKHYLLRNIEGERFEDVTEQMGLSSNKPEFRRTFATWIDYDNDGYSDLIFGRQFYRNLGGERFEKMTLKLGLSFADSTMGAVVADFDCDGWLDLYELCDHEADSEQRTAGWVEDDDFSGGRNRLLRNVEGKRFEDVTEQMQVDGGRRHTFAANWIHANDDKYPDLYIVNDFGRNCLYINRDGERFTEIAERSGVGDFANSMGVATGDIDNNGTTDIYVANMFSKMGRRIIRQVSADDYPDGVFSKIQGACAGNHLYSRVDGTQQYTEISVDKNINAIGWAYAPTLADFDSDGLLDIYATTGYISVDRSKPDG